MPKAFFVNILSVSVCFRAKLPHGRVKHETMVMGRRYTAIEAQERGLVSQICPIEKLMSTSLELCRQVTSPQPYDRHSLQQMKKDIYDWCFDEHVASLSKL